jgi:hypothetical protein
MNVVKRLTKDYFQDLFDFYKTNRVNIIRDDIFDEWIDNLSSIKEKHNSYFSGKYEFFFSGTFDDAHDLNVDGAAVLKKSKTYSAVVKSIVFKKTENGEFRELEFNNIVKAIEIYCAESGIKTIDFYTNSKNGTINYFLNLHTKYFMLFKRRIDNEENYEYIFRRKILIDYTGDPTNIRDLSLWFLDSVFIPYPNIEDSSSIIKIKDLNDHDNTKYFFTELSCYQIGPIKDPYYEVPFVIISKSCKPELLKSTNLSITAFIICSDLHPKIVKEIQEKINNSESDKILIFSIKKKLEFKCKDSNFIVWETITDQIRFIHQQYEETHG